MENKKMETRRRIYDITEFPYSREITKRVTYPFFSLNKCTGGGEIGALNIIFGKTNQGKSEVLMQFICHWIETGEKVCAVLGEHTMRKAQALFYKKVSYYDKNTWIKKSYGKDKDGKDFGIYDTFISEADEQKAIQFFKNNLFLYDTNCGLMLNDILLSYEEGLKQGCTVFVLDNAMMIDLETTAELKEQSDNAEKLRQWAKRHRVCIYLVGHARKLEDVKRIRLTVYDLMGSSNTANKGTTIMYITNVNDLNPTTKEYQDYAKLLELNFIDIHKCDAIMEVIKEKNGKGGFVPLKWYESTKTFVEVYDVEMQKKKESYKQQKLDFNKKESTKDDDEPDPIFWEGKQLVPLSKEEEESLHMPF